MDSSNVKCEVEAIIKEELKPIAIKAEAEAQAPTVSLAVVKAKTLPPLKAEPANEPVNEPGLTHCPLAYAPEAQVAALAPVVEDDEEEEEPAASQGLQVASISAIPFKREPREEPAPPGEEPEEDPYGLGPRRSRSPPASRAQLRSLAATASQKPRKKTSFFPSR